MNELRGAASAEDTVGCSHDATLWSDLACAVARGDGDAEAELARQFHPRVRAMVSARLHGSDLAADIAQETIVAVLEALRAGRLRDAEKLPSFVLGIARNLVNNYHRKEARRLEVVGAVPGTAAVDCGAPPGVDAERRALVREALKSLNDVDRRILLLTLVEGMTPREIAPVLGLTPEVVRTRKSRAVQSVADEARTRETNSAARPHK